MKIPDILPRFVPLPSSEGPTFAFLEDVIRQNLERLFPDVEMLDLNDASEASLQRMRELGHRIGRVIVDTTD